MVFSPLLLVVLAACLPTTSGAGYPTTAGPSAFLSTTPVPPPLTFHSGQLTVESVRALAASGYVEKLSAFSPLQLAFSSADKPRTYRVKFSETLKLLTSSSDEDDVLVHAGEEYLIFEDVKANKWMVKAAAPSSPETTSKEFSLSKDLVRADSSNEPVFDPHTNILHATTPEHGSYRLNSNTILFSAPKFNQWAWFQHDVQTRPWLDIDFDSHKQQFFNAGVFGIPVYEQLTRVFGLDDSGSAETTWLGWVREQASENDVMRSLLPLLPEPKFTINDMVQEKAGTTLKAFVRKLRELVVWKNADFFEVSSDEAGMRLFAPTLAERFDAEMEKLGLVLREHAAVARLEKFRQACEENFPHYDYKMLHFPDGPSWVAFLKDHVLENSKGELLNYTPEQNYELLSTFGFSPAVYDVLVKKPMDLFAEKMTKEGEKDVAKRAMWASRAVTAFLSGSCLTDAEMEQLGAALRKDARADEDFVEKTLAAERVKALEQLIPTPKMLENWKTELQLLEESASRALEEAVVRLEKFQQACEEKFPHYETHFPDWPSWVAFLKHHVLPNSKWDKVGGLNYTQEQNYELLSTFGFSPAVYGVLTAAPMDLKVEKQTIEVNNVLKGAMWLSKAATALSFSGCMTDVVNFFAVFVHAYEKKGGRYGLDVAGAKRSSSSSFSGDDDNNEPIAFVSSKDGTFFGGAKSSEDATREVIQRYGEMLFRLGKILNVYLKDPSVYLKDPAAFFVLEELHVLRSFFGAVNIQYFVGDMESDDAIVLALLVIVPTMFNEAVALTTKFLGISVEPLPLLDSVTLQLATDKLSDQTKNQIENFLRGVLQASNPTMSVRVMADGGSTNGEKVGKYWGPVLAKLDSGEPEKIAQTKQSRSNLSPDVADVMENWFRSIRI